MKKLLLIAIVFISRFVIDGFILPSWAISPVNYTRLTQDRGEWAEVVQRILDEDFEEAARLAKNLTSKTPEVTFLKGFLAYQAGNYAEALEKFGQIQDSFASLREFILFYMALCAKELENLPKMNALFHQIFQEYPDSALTPLYQQTLLEHLMALGKYQEALNFVEHLEPQKNSPFALWLQHTNADLYERLDQPTKAFEMYLQLWIEYPLEDVGRTDQDWRRLAQKVKRQPTPEQFFTRIENIMKKGRYDIALEELQAMRKVYPELDVVMEARWHLVKGECLYESKQDELAIEHLQKIEDRELLPEALYYLQLTYFRRTEQPKYARLFEQTAAILINYPREKSKTWRERSLQKLAKHFEADPPVDYARSIAISQQLVNEHPNSIYAPEAKWKIAWLYYLQNDYQKALQGLEQLDQELAKNPRGQWELIPQVKYWRGKTFEALGKQAEALKVYQEVNNTYPFHYYGYLSRLRLQETQPPVTGKEVFPTINTLTEGTKKTYQQFKDLIMVGFYNYARDVLLHLANTAPKKERAWLAYELARFYVFLRKPDQAIRAIARSQLDDDFIRCQAQNPPPSELYAIYYPQLYHEWLVTETTKNHLPDPFLIHAVIYHESLYNANAISPRGAIGLMQVMPELLAQYRDESGENDLEVDDLFDPSVNIRIGCYKLGQNIKELQHLIPALLSYNADIAKVKQWLPYTSDTPFDLYIEQVPFIQTQVFFKRVYETYCEYLRIYGGRENVLN